MMGRRGSRELVRIFGIRIGVDVSWFFVLFLAIFVLQDSFKQTIAGSDTTAYIAAVAAAFLFFGSIVLHEMGHALAARREGIEVTGIDLFFFGGLMRMSRETETPGAEFRVAAAGPLVTLLLAGGAFGVAVLIAGSAQEAIDAALLRDGSAVGVALTLVGFTAAMNLALLLFNLVPAFPLDGGRIARAIVWWRTGDRNKATRVSAALGRAFGSLLIVGGVYFAFAGYLYDGIWLAVLGWLINQSARGALLQSAFSERIGGITVADIMDREPVTIPADLPARQAFEEYFLRYGYDWFAVVDGEGRYVGRAERVPVQASAEAEGAGALTPVRDLIGSDAEGHVAEGTPLESLLSSDALRRLGSLVALDTDGRLRGVVTREQVARALQSRIVSSEA